MAARAGWSFGDAREHLAQLVIEGNDGLAAPPALSGGQRDRILSNM
jgi:hypothetical protein